jgi:sugar O-acyltransferase (sialic acid O-acetyltransferase NeuD family)
MAGSKPIIILGTGGSSIDILDVLNDINSMPPGPKYRCIGFLDDDQAHWGKEICGVKVLGPLHAARDFPAANFINGIGTPANFLHKEAIIAQTRLPVEHYETVVHPSASVSRMATLGFGIAVLQNVTINSYAHIGDHVIILANTVISHNDVIGAYTCIASGACLAGNVKIGKLCYVGTNSTIIGNVSIGDYCLIGMGSVVLHDVGDNSVVAGNPAKFLRHTRAV